MRSELPLVKFFVDSFSEVSGETSTLFYGKSMTEPKPSTSNPAPPASRGRINFMAFHQVSHMIWADAQTPYATQNLDVSTHLRQLITHLRQLLIRNNADKITENYIKDITLALKQTHKQTHAHTCTQTRAHTHTLSLSDTLTHVHTLHTHNLLSIPKT